MLDPEDHLDLDAVVAVVNEYGAATRDAAGESADPFPAEPPITGLPVDALRRIADAWFTIFAAGDDLGTTAAELDAHLGALTPALRIDHAHGRVTAQLGNDALDAEHQVLLAGFLSLLGALCAQQRIGTCVGDECLDVYVDRSPRQSRAYCSTRCQTRARVRRHRLRSG